MATDLGENALEEWGQNRLYRLITMWHVGTVQCRFFWPWLWPCDSLAYSHETKTDTEFNIFSVGANNKWPYKYSCDFGRLRRIAAKILWQFIWRTNPSIQRGKCLEIFSSENSSKNCLAPLDWIIGPIYSSCPLANIMTSSIFFLSMNTTYTAFLIKCKRTSFHV